MEKISKCIALIGDPHLPGRNLELKRKVIQDINSWSEVDMVLCTGDLCETYGTDEEFRFAAEFFEKLTKPFFTLIGNHDNFYSDGGYFRATSLQRKEKIHRFHRHFPTQKLFSTMEYAGLRFYFLAVEGFESPYFSGVSEEQIEWFERELAANFAQKSVVFCHAPLWSEEIVKVFPQAVNYIIQPAERFKRIIQKNEQVVLWVSGHVHFGMKKELINHPFNLYEGRVINILNCDMDGFSVLDLNIKPEFHDQIWTRKLHISPEGFRCSVYDHNKDIELTELEMTGKF